MAQDTFPPVPRVARFDITGTMVGVTGTVLVQNSLYVRCPATEVWEALTLFEMATEIADWWDDSMETITYTGATFTGVRYKSLETPGLPVVELTRSIPGTVAGGAALFVGAPIVQFIGEFGLQPARSYIRVWGAAESQTAGNGVDTAYDTALSTAFDSYITRVNAFSPGSWGVLTADPVIISVYEPKNTPGYDPDQPFRDEGIHNVITGPTVRTLIGRAVSRQT